MMGELEERMEERMEKGGNLRLKEEVRTNEHLVNEKNIEIQSKNQAQMSSLLNI